MAQRGRSGGAGTPAGRGCGVCPRLGGPEPWPAASADGAAAPPTRAAMFGAVTRGVAKAPGDA